MADTPDIYLSYHIHSPPLSTLLWEVDPCCLSFFFSETLAHFSRLSGSLRRIWKGDNSIWLGYSRLGLPMMLPCPGWVLKKALIFQRRPLWNFLFLSHSLCLFVCWLWKKLAPGFQTTLHGIFTACPQLLLCK